MKKYNKVDWHILQWEVGGGKDSFWLGNCKDFSKETEFKLSLEGWVGSEELRQSAFQAEETALAKAGRWKEIESVLDHH